MTQPQDPYSQGAGQPGAGGPPNPYGQTTPYGQVGPYGQPGSSLPPGMMPGQNYVPPSQQLQEASSKKLAAGLLAILLGELGIHKFILGYTTAGVIMLLCTVLTCGIVGIVMKVIGLIEGIMYLTKTDADFYQMYMANKKEWF